MEKYISDLRRLVRIPSVLDESDPKFVFGKAINDALHEVVAIANELGFSTYIDPEGYYAYAEIGSGEMFGVLGHLDVVAAGDLNKWDYPAFDVTQVGDRLYGRGTQDDKGPVLASMYALKSLLDEGYVLKKKVRFIFGTDEESLWRGIKRYEEKEEMPTAGFSPDSKFPLIYAEKGLLQLKLTCPNTSSLRVKGGDAFNAVPSIINYNGEHVSHVEETLKNLGFEYSIENGISVIGKAMHAQVANEGVNAITRLFESLDGQTSSNAVKFVNSTFKHDAHATSIFGEIEDEHSGKLMFNLGMVDINEKEEVLCIDVRIPVTVSKDDIVNKLIAVAKEYGLEYAEYDWLRSIYVPIESELIQSLMASYQEVTGDLESKPVTSGGATYARAMDNCVAFGSVLPTGVKTEHQPNEYISITDMKIAIEIYKKAFTKLV